MSDNDLSELKDLLSAKKDEYTEPKFGTMRWLSAQAGYQKISKLIKEDCDIKEALYNLIMNT